MSNGIASLPARISLVLLAASIAVSAGCDTSRAPSQPPHAASAAPQVPSIQARQRADPARNRVWILNSRGLFLHYATTGELVEVSLPSWQWVDMPHACPPGLALGPKGEVVVTSNVVPTLWRIDPDSLAVSVHEVVLDTDKDKDVGFSRIEYSSEHGVFFAASDVHGSLWRIDPLLRKGQKVLLPAPIKKAPSCPTLQTRSPHDGD